MAKRIGVSFPNKRKFHSVSALGHVGRKSVGLAFWRPHGFSSFSYVNSRNKLKKERRGVSTMSHLIWVEVPPQKTSAHFLFYLIIRKGTPWSLLGQAFQNGMELCYSLDQLWSTSHDWAHLLCPDIWTKAGYL